MVFLIQQEAGSLRRRPRLMQISELPRWIVKDDAEVNINSKLGTSCVSTTEKKIWVYLGVRTFEFFCFVFVTRAGILVIVIISVTFKLSVSLKQV